MLTQRNIIAFIVLVIMCAEIVAGAADTEKAGKVSSNENVPIIKPWKIIVQDKDYNGAWMVSGDLTG